MIISAASSLRNQKFAIWCGPVFTILTLIGWVGFAQGLFPVPASLTPEATAQHFATHHLGMKIGCVIYMIACAFFAVWIAQLGVMMARLEGRMPVFAIVQVTAGNGVALFVMLSCSLWIGAAYRPLAHPDVVVALNDAAWIGFLLTWPSLSAQMLSTGWVTLQDPRPEGQRMVPRWVSYWSFFCGVAICTATGPAFFKDGPFAWNGIGAYYIPMILWSLWFDVNSWFMYKTLVREAQAANL